MTTADSTAITALGTSSSGSEGLSICALVCSSKLNWGVDANNLPYQYTANGSSVLTKENSNAAALANTYCLGFEATVTGSADGLSCHYYYDAFPTGNTAETSAASTTQECLKRNLSTLA